MVKMAVFDFLKPAKIDFTFNYSVRKIAKIPHCDGKLSFYHKYTIPSSDGYRGRLFGIPSTYPTTTSIVVFYYLALF